MKWFLVVYLFINGQWIIGDKYEYDGWGAMEQPNENVCLEKRDRANRINDPSLFVFECEQRQVKTLHYKYFPN